MKYIALLLLLSGCGSVDISYEKDKEVAQQNLDRLVPTCRDGVQYLLSPWSGASTTAIPRMKPDGSLYRCGLTRTQRVVSKEYWEQ